ncbi:hypothetical protein TWF481_011648 [Arthrobotrys musiformis]|uniref:C2H2-type domain-containing protein n=1 Tax=Arthrobotrys musiformis TaxID=47236 RepID=A0AAV9VZ57_9PEZI
MLASTSPRPTKRPRRSSESGDMSFKFSPMRQWPPTTPILLRKLDPTTVITKVLEGMANERLLKSSDLLELIIKDQFLGLSDIQNRNNFNVKEAKVFICRQIGPILYRFVNQYLDSVTTQDADGEVLSPLEAPQAAMPQKKQKSENENTSVEAATAAAEPKPERKMPPPFPSQIESLDSLEVTAEETTLAVLDHNGDANAAPWLKFGSSDNPYPFRQNWPFQSSPVNGMPAENATTGRFTRTQPARTKSDAAIPDDSISMSNSSPVKARSTVARPQSISGRTTGDQQETRSVVSTTRKRTAKSSLEKSCTFCFKDLPSPSARREHEAIHVHALCGYKQYQCKINKCPYRSHRPREIAHHMKNRHPPADGQNRGASSMELLLDHGPLSEERMAQLRQQFHSERAEGVNLTTANFGQIGFPTPSIKTTDRDLQTDRDELASQHNTIVSMDYSYTQGAPLQQHIPQHISSSMFPGMGSAYGDSGSLLIDQSSQADYAMGDLVQYRGSMGTFATSPYLPQAPQLLGVGAAHAGSSLIHIPPTIDVDEDAQGENDLEWAENLVVHTMKGG